MNTLALPAQTQTRTADRGRFLFAALRVWHQRARQRRQLAGLEAWQLCDIGLDMEQVRREASKPFWQA